MNYTDPSGHDPCTNGTYVSFCPPSSKNSARIYYLNSIGLGSNTQIAPSPYPDDEQAYTLYQLGRMAGTANVHHVPVYTSSDLNSIGGRAINYYEMFGEAFEHRTYSPGVANAIADDIAQNPLTPGQRIVIVGASGGGTVAVETLELLQEEGIFVDQLILRGSLAKEASLVNVGRVDYITGNYILGVVPSDHYYSYDSNPNDGVQVVEHRVDFSGHVPPDNRTRGLVANLIVNLVFP